MSRKNYLGIALSVITVIGSIGCKTTSASNATAIDPAPDYSEFDRAYTLKEAITTTYSETRVMSEATQHGLMAHLSRVSVSDELLCVRPQSSGVPKILTLSLKLDGSRLEIELTDAAGNVDKQTYTGFLNHQQGRIYFKSFLDDSPATVIPGNDRRPYFQSYFSTKRGTDTLGLSFRKIDHSSEGSGPRHLCASSTDPRVANQLMRFGH